MSGPGWDNEAWRQIRDYELFWTPFDTRFRFRAGTRPEGWPAIDEPAGSVTFDLSPFFERGQSVAADADALNEQVLSATTEVFPADVALVALNWQHPSYWFWPHRQATEREPWRIPPFPAKDLTPYFPDVVSAVRDSLPTGTVVDGELVVFDTEGGQHGVHGAAGPDHRRASPGPRGRSPAGEPRVVRRAR